MELPAGEAEQMGEKSRIKFIVLIALILAVAIIYSFSVSNFQDTPEVGFAKPEPSQNIGPGGQDLPGGTVQVEVTPDTVQNVIRTLDRYTSYRRSVSVEYLSGGEVISSLTAEVAVDGGWTRCDVTELGDRTEHTIVGDDTRWIWYEDSPDYARLPAGQAAPDLAQRLPTYEDVLDLDRSAISAAGYEFREGLPCVYVEVVQSDLDYQERFWVSVESGLLVASETVKGEETVYRMSSYQVETPLSEVGDSFTLPDGTVLYQPEGRTRSVDPQG